MKTRKGGSKLNRPLVLPPPMRIGKYFGIGLLGLLVFLFGYHWIQGPGVFQSLGMTVNDFKVTVRCPHKPQTVLDFIRRDGSVEFGIRFASELGAKWTAEVCNGDLKNLSMQPTPSFGDDASNDSVLERMTLSNPPKSQGSPWVTDFDRLEKAIHDRVNQHRANHGQRALTFDPKIALEARKHSEFMALVYDVRGLVHFDETGFPDPFPSLGFICGENVLMRPRSLATTSMYGMTVQREDDMLQMSDAELADDLVQQWIASSPHEKNMREADYRVGGVGVFYSKEREEVFATHNLCFRN